RLLVEREGRRAGGRLPRHRDRDDVAGVQRARRHAPFAEREVGGGKETLLPRRPNDEALGLCLEDHAACWSSGGWLCLGLTRQERVDLLRLQVADGAAEALALVELAEPLANGLLGGALHAEVAGRVDLEAELIGRGAAVAFFQQPA